MEAIIKQIPNYLILYKDISFSNPIYIWNAFQDNLNIIALKLNYYIYIIIY